MSVSKTLHPLLSTGSTQEDRKSLQHGRKIVDWEVKQQHKQNSLEITHKGLVCA